MWFLGRFRFTEEDSHIPNMKYDRNIFYGAHMIDWFKKNKQKDRNKCIKTQFPVVSSKVLAKLKLDRTVGACCVLKHLFTHEGNLIPWKSFFLIVIIFPDNFSFLFHTDRPRYALILLFHRTKSTLKTNNTRMTEMWLQLRYFYVTFFFNQRLKVDSN